MYLTKDNLIEVTNDFTKSISWINEFVEEQDLLKDSPKEYDLNTLKDKIKKLFLSYMAKISDNTNTKEELESLYNEYKEQIIFICTMSICSACNYKDSFGYEIK